jgi:phosphatidylglycerophosphate synthase
MGPYAARDVVRVPGLLSLARIPLGVAFPFVVDRPVLAMTVLAASAVTDVADGWYARRFGQETAMGRILDPITDKAFVTMVVGTMLLSKRLSVVEALLLGTRELCELVLLAWWAIAGRKRSRPAYGANRLGKIATVTQFIAVVAVLSGTTQHLLWIAPGALFGVLAGWSYARREWRHWTKAAPA